MRHVLVTGAGQGIGAAIVQALAAEGHRVTLLGRRRAPLQALVDADPAQRHAVTADVADAAQVAAAVAAARERFGAITILINNAGQAGSAPFARTSAKLWEQMLAVNLTGTFHCTQAVLPDLLAEGWGRIVNVASTAALRGYAYVSAYVAAKHGVLGLTRALALELATKGITVNAVCPGFTETALLEASVARIVAQTGRTPEAARAELAAGNPQRRLVQPDEVADAVRWLCGAAAASVNGQAIAVCGGETQ